MWGAESRVVNICRQNPTSEAVAAYEGDVARLQAEVDRLRDQLAAPHPDGAPARASEETALQLRKSEEKCQGMGINTN